jgi:hypothetical protein
LFYIVFRKQLSLPLKPISSSIFLKVVCHESCCVQAINICHMSSGLRSAGSPKSPLYAYALRINNAWILSIVYSAHEFRLIDATYYPAVI